MFVLGIVLPVLSSLSTLSGTSLLATLICLSGLQNASPRQEMAHGCRKLSDCRATTRSISTTVVGILICILH